MTLQEPLPHQGGVPYDAAAVLEEATRLGAAGQKLRARDMARTIGVPEAALVEARRLQGKALALRRPGGTVGFGSVLSPLTDAGEVMALTRNEACVSEKHGVYGKPSFHGTVGQVLGEIDLRLFLRHWVHGYAVTEETKSGERFSLQFFDSAGDAVHKIYATDGTDRDWLDALVAEHADPDALPALYAPPLAEPDELRDEEIDAEGFRYGWRNLQHSHDFFGLLRDFRVTRRQAMRLGAPEFTRRVEPSAAEHLLIEASGQGVPLMIFVGNRGCVQIFSGTVSRVARVNDWMNVLDPRFNLHLRTDLIDEAWVVRKPSARGDVHALELYDASGFCFAQFFGERKPGTTERGDWRALVTALEWT